MELYYRLVYLNVFLQIFIDYTLFQRLGWDITSANLPYFFRLLPNIYILILSTYYLQIKRKVPWEKLKVERNCLSFLVAASIFLLIRFRFIAVFSIVSCLLPAVLLSVNLSVLPREKGVALVRKSLYIFFIIESLMCIVESLTMTQLLPPLYESGEEDILVGEYNDEFGQFRATALHGHPLANALILDIIMTFFLITTVYTQKKKLILYCIGLISLLCLNERSSIIYMTALLFFFLGKKILSKDTSLLLKIGIIVLPLILGVFFLYLITNFGLGGRLLLDKEMEGSADARIMIYVALLSFPIESIFWGVDLKAFKNMVLILCNGHMESYWVIFIAYMGLIVFIPLLVVFSFFLLKHSPPKTFDKFVVLGSFVLLSSTNNSLACGIPAMTIYILSSYAFLKR